MDGAPGAGIGGALGSAGCEGPPVEISPGVKRCANGFVHRTLALTCPEYPATEGPIFDTNLQDGKSRLLSCLQDADCTLAANGRCVYQETTWGHSTECFYGCATDDDCGADALCECLGGKYGQCVEAQCRTDADCDSEQRCFRLPQDASGPVWACTRNDDECRLPSDCPQGAVCLAGHSGSSSGTRCGPMPGTGGTMGRPFFVGGYARTSAPVPREDWCQRLKPRLAGMSAERRRILGEYWTRVALLEHASIAAFLRFSLELLAVGAPHAFLDEATRAIADETRHARLAFGLATAYLGYGVGAGELSAPDALDRFDLRTVTVETLLSGCIGETLAAIAASEALERCEDETVRTVLVEIVRDETRHAKLAWRFVQWATAIDPMLLDELLELTEVERSRPLTREWLPPAEERWRRRHGMHEASITLRDRVLTEIVAPCLQTLRRERPVGRIRSAPTAHPPA